jgi:N-acetyl-gamma-glutamyl-phosphate reductase
MIRTAIIGASGYSGAEVFRFLSRRDDVDVVQLIASSSSGRRIAELYPSLAAAGERTLESIDDLRTDGIDLAFVALPSGEAMRVSSGIAGKVSRVIDLSGDFRLKDPATYEMFYRRPHTSPDLLATAVYGLPELNAEAIAGARFVANPGCYPTGAILALMPALRHGAVKTHGIVINSLSGVSGAGRSAAQELSFSEVNENVRAYKVGSHQHLPEIESVLSLAAGKPVTVSFLPHLIPVTRGIYTSVHATLAGPVTTDEVRAMYADFYRAAPFVRMRSEVPQIGDVVRTNYCDLFVHVDARSAQLVVISVIDNLVKGAAGQAIQNMNIMFGQPQHLGLR